MPGTEPSNFPPRASAGAERFKRKASWLCFGLFVAEWALVTARLAGADWIRTAQCPECGLLVLWVAATLTLLSRRLPWQNVLLASGLILVIAVIVETLAAHGNWPFGHRVYTSKMAPALLHAVPWPVPWIWLAIILNSREVAGLVLWHHRAAPNYGWWRMGLTVLLVLGLWLGLEPYGSRLMGYWRWSKAVSSSGTYSPPWLALAGWGLVTVFILGVVTPMLLNKKPVEPPPSYLPGALWLLVSALVLIAAAVEQQWVVAGLESGLASMVGWLVWRGNRRQRRA